MRGKRFTLGITWVIHQIYKMITMQITLCTEFRLHSIRISRCTESPISCLLHRMYHHVERNQDRWSRTGHLSLWVRKWQISNDWCSHKWAFSYFLSSQDKCHNQRSAFICVQGPIRRIYQLYFSSHHFKYKIVFNGYWGNIQVIRMCVNQRL